MHARFLLVFVLLTLVTNPALCQSNLPANQRVVSRDIRPEPLPGFDQQSMHRKAIAQDVADLSVLSSSLQQDLQRLQHGLLAKDLKDKLKKIEKLSKRLRHEMDDEAAAIAFSAR